MGKAGMWLIQNIGILNFLTAPPLPNFEFVGGFHCRPVKTLCLRKSFPSAIQTCFGEKKKNMWQCIKFVHTILSYSSVSYFIITEDSGLHDRCENYERNARSCGYRHYKTVFRCPTCKKG